MIASGLDPSDVLPTSEIRDHFPALRRAIAGEYVAYFDGPGGTQVPRMVVEAMADYLYCHNANTHWAFPSSRETDEIIGQGRQSVADFLNADPGEVAFGNNMTTLTFHLARALGRRLVVGDEVMVTELDHHANIDPWRAMASERGVTVKTVRMRPDDGQLDWDDLESQVSDRTKILAIGAASNAIGTINDVARASKVARNVGALTFVDAVHYAPHRLIDVRAFGCDFLACSAYKFYGPHLGILYGKGELIRSLDVPKLQPSPDTAPERLETGTQNHEGIAGTAAAVDFLAGLAKGPDRRSRLAMSFEALHQRSMLLVNRLWSGLESIERVRLFGPRPDQPRTPTISFALAGKTPQQVCQGLAGRGVFASHGNFYATTAIERLGRSAAGLVRVGCACYTSEEEVDRLLHVVGEIAKG